MARWMRQAHRWVSLVFCGFVLANIGANIAGVEAMWLGLLTLLPLLFLILSGLYLFWLPYRRGAAA